MPDPRSPRRPAILDWLRDGDTLARRLVLSEVLAPPRSRRPITPPAPPAPPAPSTPPSDVTKTPVRKAIP